MSEKNQDDLGQAFGLIVTQELASRAVRAAQARIDFPDIAAAVDAVIASGIAQGMTPEDARDGVHWKWAYNRHTGAEMGRAPAGAREAAEAYWTELDNGGKTIPPHNREE